MRLDLHLHTTASDGAWSPEAVVRGAVDGGLDVIAITDHDTLGGVARAQAAARDHSIQVVPGIELSSTFGHRDVHILGYFVDTTNSELVRYADRAEHQREHRMRQMLQRLGAQGIDVPFRAVEQAAGDDRGVIGRPHLAQALVEAGYATSVPDAFNHLIGDGSEAFVSAHMLDPAEAVDLVARSGGIAMWAHPPGEIVDELLPSLIESGLGGLEVFRPRNRRSDMLRYESICKTNDLLMSGGSDWHSPNGGSALGDFYVEAEEVDALLAAGGL